MNAYQGAGERSFTGGMEQPLQGFFHETLDSRGPLANVFFTTFDQMSPLPTSAEDTYMQDTTETSPRNYP